MAQAGVLSLRAKMPDGKIWLLFDNKIPYLILWKHFEAIKVLYLSSILNVEEISIIFSVFKPEDLNSSFSPEFEERVSDFSQYDKPDGLIASVNEAVFSKKENAYLAFNLNYRLRDKNSKRKKWVVLYFCLVLSCLQ